MMHEIKIYESDADLLKLAMREAQRENDYQKAGEVLHKWAEPILEPYQEIANKMRYISNISGMWGFYHKIWFEYVEFVRRMGEQKLGGRMNDFFVSITTKALESHWLKSEYFGRIIYDNPELHRKVNTLANAHVFHLGLDGGVYPGRNFPDLVQIPENLKELPENVR